MGSDLIKSLLPPVLLLALQRLLGRLQVDFRGRYHNWHEASQQAKGYEADAIFDKVLAANLAVQRGEAVYERDGVLFDTVQIRFETMAGLARIALEAGHLNLVDFGGGLGSSYHQFKSLFDNSMTTDWCIVEQPRFVECGDASFTLPDLHFKSQLETALKPETNVVLFSSSLQYVETPERLIQLCRARGVPYVLVDLTPMSRSSTSVITVQSVREPIYDADYPCWIFSQLAFNTSVMAGYQPVLQFDGPELAGLSQFNAAYRGGLYQLMVDQDDG